VESTETSNMMTKLKLSLIALLLLAATLFLPVRSGATDNRPKTYKFVMGSYPGLVVHIGTEQTDTQHTYSLVNGDRIDATWPGGCAPTGGGTIGYVFVNDANGNPIAMYQLKINAGCESGSWTINTSATPPYNPGQQYCPCQGQP
jgi:hypothetical protein